MTSDCERPLEDFDVGRVGELEDVKDEAGAAPGISQISIIHLPAPCSRPFSWGRRLSCG